MNIRVGIVEDNKAIRESLALILNSSPGIRCCGAWSSAEEALCQLPRQAPDVVLMDINLPGASGIECVRQIKSTLPQVQAIMLTIEGDSKRVFESLKAGATGYLVKNLPPVQILEAIEEVHRGGSPMSSQIARLLVQQFQQDSRSDGEKLRLSPREEQVLALAAKGYRSKEIADALSISAQTVETHFRNLYEKLQVRSRAEAVARFVQRRQA